MALRKIEGFELDTSVAALQRIYQNTVIDAGITFPAGRVHGACLKAGPTPTTWQTQDMTAATTWIVGIGLRATNPESPMLLERLMDSGNELIRLELNDTATGYTISCKRGGTTIATSAITLLDDQWYFVEWKVTLNATTGSTELRVNQSSASGFAVSGVNTTNTGATTANRVEWNIEAQASGTTSVYIDDIYVFDTTGSDNNDFAGDSIAEGLFPTSDGDSLQFTPDSGSTHFSQVDEPTVADDDTTYLQSSTNGNIDLFHYGNLVVINGNILGIEVQEQWRLLAAGSRNVRTKHKHTDATISNGTTKAVTTTAYANKPQIWERNPGTAGLWTVADVNGMQLGFENVA